MMVGKTLKRGLAEFHSNVNRMSVFFCQTYIGLSTSSHWHTRKGPNGSVLSSYSEDLMDSHSNKWIRIGKCNIYPIRSNKEGIAKAVTYPLTFTSLLLCCCIPVFCWVNQKPGFLRPKCCWKTSPKQTWSFSVAALFIQPQKKLTHRNKNRLLRIKNCGWICGWFCNGWNVGTVWLGARAKT